MTRAAPKVADYPFTTLEPVLGTLDGVDRQLVIADIPGLIEGASEGHGLGHEFLAHVERTRLLVHVLELTPVDGSDPEENFATIEHELASYDERLATLPRILALSKADLVPAEESEAARRRRGARAWGRTSPCSSPPARPARASTSWPPSCCGASRSRRRRWPRTSPTPRSPSTAPSGPAPTRRCGVERVGEHEFRVGGPQVERLLQRYDIDNEEALEHIEHRLRRLGVIDRLHQEGFEPGDDVEIAGVVFELDP